MEIRLLLKTHYQINKPGIFSVILRNCTSPTQSSYPEVISGRLANVYFKHTSLNKEAAKFAVSMAQSFGFLTKNMFWDWKGHAINILLAETQRETPDDYLKLNDAEKMLYLKYYLEVDGATIIEICKRLISRENITRSELLNTDFIDKIFIDIWETYRSLATDLIQKVQLRENVNKLKLRPYTYKTRIHKAQTHVESLIDFDFIEKKGARNKKVFYPNNKKSTSPINNLIKEIDTIESMERRFSKFEHFRIISNVYNLSPIAYNKEIHSKKLQKQIFKTYLKARTQPTKMAAIAIIADVISVTFLAKDGILIDRPQIEQEIDKLKVINSGEIHYHYDMSGRKAFVVISDKLCKSDNRL